MLSLPRLAGTLLLLLSLLSSVHAAAIPSYDRDAHEHVSQGPLPDRWYHDDDHFAHALFRRQAPTPSFPEVGSQAWSAGFPAGTPTAVPQAWTDVLNKAVQAGKIPNIPQTTLQGTTTVYDASLNPGGPQVCSYSYGCRINGSIYDAPPGVIGLAFDDGPLPPSDNLSAFLKDNQVRATHFYIGTNILYHWQEFNTAFQNQDDIAVHTWTHPHMTSLSNADVVAQLGWSLQLIYNSTEGRLARYWRPPYGDTDLRVTAIAKEVFGLTNIGWNQDSQDWSLNGPGGSTPGQVQGRLQGWISGNQNPGLIILEHELSNEAVQAFITVFPLIKQHNWDLKSVATLSGLGAYQNANDSSQPTPVPLTAGGDGGAGLLPTSTSQPSPAASTTSTSSSSSTGASHASASPGNGVKTSGTVPRLRLSPVALSLASALAFGVLAFA